MQASELIGKVAHRTAKANVKKLNGDTYTDGSYMTSKVKILRVTPTHIVTEGRWNNGEWSLLKSDWDDGNWEEVKPVFNKTDALCMMICGEKMTNELMFDPDDYIYWNGVDFMVHTRMKEWKSMSFIKSEKWTIFSPPKWIPKFQVGDFVKDKTDGYYYRIQEIVDNGYNLILGEHDCPEFYSESELESI